MIAAKTIEHLQTGKLKRLPAGRNPAAGLLSIKCRHWLVLLLVVCGLLSPLCADAGGTWTALAHAPPAGLDNALLLSDGTVICGNGNQNWYQLTPDSHGSYVNGTWGQIAATTYGRLFYSCDVLPNGNVYVAGGEYGNGRNYAELYNPLANTWTVIPQPSGAGYGDACSKILPGGNVLQGSTGSATYLYQISSGTIVNTTSALGNQNEACWVRMPNDNVVTLDTGTQNSEHYVPSLNAWYADGGVPVALYGYGAELGAAFVLPNGKMFQLGATPHTAIYTPGGSLTAAGSWVAGPDVPNGLGQVDAPAAMMANGRILCAVGPTNGFNGPTSYYEYDYTANNFTLVNSPGGVDGNPPFVTSMLDLPDGNILLIDGQGTTSLYVYQPAGTPLAASQPAISSIVENADGSYHLTGTGLNGITGGAAYGDDWQMDTSYPLVRMTNNVSGNVYYARTYNWSSTAIQNPNPATTEFMLPAGLPAGTYALVVTANGNASAPVTFVYSPSAAPTGVSATPGNAQVSLSWNAVSGATAYNVLRSPTGGGPYYVPVATVTGTNYTNTGLINGLPYYYVVTAVSSGGPSARSTEAGAAPIGPPPTPTGVSATADAPALVNLSWNASFEAVSYNVKRSTANGGPYTTIATPAGPGYNDTNVAGGTTYFYVISAVGLNGESTNSSQIIVSPLPSPWVTFDVGSVAATGSASYSNTVFTVNGSGADVWGTNDAFRFVYQAVSGNCDIRARVASVQNSNPSSKGGVMIRETLNSSSTHVFMELKGGGGLEFLYRTATGGSTGAGSASGNAPQWVRLTRTNTTFTAYYSANGTSWTQVGTAAISMATTFYAGLAVCSHNDGVLCAGVFNNVSVAGGAPPVPAAPAGLSASGDNAQVNLTWNSSAGATIYNVKRATVSGGPYTLVGSPGVQQTSTNFTDLGLAGATAYYYVVSAANGGGESADSTEISITTLPSPWVTGDVGLVAAAGSASYSNSVFTVNGSGADIWGNADAFRYVYQTINGNCDIRARVVSVQNVNSSAKGGVMIRGSLEDDSSHALVDLKGGGGLEFIWRTHGSSSSSSGSASGNAPQWVRLTRTNNTITAYYSANGTGWTQLGTPQTIGIGPVAYVGLAVCSHSDGTLCAGIFDNVVINSTVAPVAPAGLSATAGNSQAGLTWNSSSGAASYNVKRSITNGGPYTIISSPAGTNYTDAGLANGTAYYYVVSAVNAGGESANSSQVSVTPIAVPPAPAGLGATAGDVQVGLIWNSSSGATGYNVKRSTGSGSEATITNVAGTNYTDISVTNGTTYYYVVSAVNAGGESANSSEVSAMPLGSLPAPWLTADIGSVGVAGGASYSGGVFTVNGSGNDISNSADAFRYVYQPVSGNFTLTARVASQANTDPWAKAGVMARETVNADSRYFGVYVTPASSHGVSVQCRSTTGSNTVDVTDISGPAAPYWVRIVRNKNTFTAYRSADGTTWNRTGMAQGITMSTNIFLGLPVCSRNNSTLCPATFDNVTVAPVSQTNAPVVISSALMQTNGQFTLEFQGESDLNYVVEASTNLADWLPVYTNALPAGGDGVFIFSDTNSAAPASFYRVSQ